MLVRTQRELYSTLPYRRERLNRGFTSYESQSQRYLPFNRMNEMSWGWMNEQQVSFSSPETDILELDDRFILEVSLPGVVLDDVELKVEENYISLIAKRTPNMFEERATYLRKELPCHFLVREFEFEDEICVEEIEARLERGILFISVPKFESAVRIPVSAGSIEQHLSEGTTRVSKTEGRKVTVK